jgi:prevent-host-death family protein
MKIASVANVKAKFSVYLKSSEEGPVVITRNGRPVAVLLGVADEEEIERLLMAYSPRLRAILDRSRVQIGKGENVAHEQLWTEDEPPATSPSSRRIKGTDRHGFWGRFVKSLQNTAFRRFSVAFHGLGNGRRLC